MPDFITRICCKIYEWVRKRIYVNSLNDKNLLCVFNAEIILTFLLAPEH